MVYFQPSLIEIRKQFPKWKNLIKMEFGKDGCMKSYFSTYLFGSFCIFASSMEKKSSSNNKKHSKPRGYSNNCCINKIKIIFIFYICPTMWIKDLQQRRAYFNQIYSVSAEIIMKPGQFRSCPALSSSRDTRVPDVNSFITN